MNKKIKIILSIVIILLIFSIFTIFFFNTNILYSTTYYFEFGSRSVKIYTNGEVFDDLEIENPNHKSDYKYLKTLTQSELNDLIHVLDNESDSEIIKNYVIELVYGVTEFDASGNY